MGRGEQHYITEEARRDIAWWERFMQDYNGISILWYTKIPEADGAIASDACPKGFGAICGKEYIQGTFPEELQGSNIAHLEIMAVVIALRTWHHKLKGKYFWIMVDNEAVATILNTGASRDPVLQQALRETLMIAAKNEFMIKAKHIRGVDNRILDWLSRWHEPEARKKFQKVAQEQELIKTTPGENCTYFTNIW